MIRNVLQPAPLPLNMHKIQAHAQSNPQSWRSGQSSPTPSNATLGSLSWFAERSATELIPLLKEAYSALREKERDLFLAAEIGKSLLENNITLKTKYEGLLQQLQLYREAQSRPRITAGTGDKFSPSAEGIPGIIVNGDEDDDDDDPDRIREISFDDDTDSLNGAGGPRYSTSGIKSRKRALSTNRARQAATIEIEKLEQENMELQSRLHLALGEADEREKQTRQRQKQLEKELDALKSELGGATQKVEELEEEKEKLVEVKKSLLVENGPRGGRLSPNSREAANQEGDDPIINQLLEKLQGLEQTNDNLSKTKSNLEQKLTATLRDLSSLKQEFETCEFTQDDYKSLQDAYQRQFKHIAELNESLEEHRNMLVSVREKQQLRGGGGGSVSSSGRSARHRSRDIDNDDSEVLRDSLGSRYSRGRSPSGPSVRSNSPSPLTMSGSRRSRRDSVSSWSTVLSEAAEMMEGLMGMAGPKKGRAPPKNLLSELEDKWFREAGISDNSSVRDMPLGREGAFGEKAATGSDGSRDSSHPDSAPLQDLGTANTTPEPPTPSKSFTQLLTSPGELALDTLLSRTGFDRSFLDECFEFIHEAQSVGLFDEEFYPSSDIDSMEDRMGMMGMVATKEGSEVAERKGLVGWVVRLLRRVFRAVWRWCRFLGVLVAAVVISVMRGPDEIMVEYGEEW